MGCPVRVKALEMPETWTPHGPQSMETIRSRFSLPRTGPFLTWRPPECSPTMRAARCRSRGDPCVDRR